VLKTYISDTNTSSQTCMRLTDTSFINYDSLLQPMLHVNHPLLAASVR